MCWIKKKTYSYLINDSSEDKKAKGTRKFAINIKHKFENYKKCLEATQPEDKINHLVKKIDIGSFWKKSQKIHKKQQIKIKNTGESERQNVFTEKINKTALNSNDDKIMQSIDSIESNVYGTSTDLVSQKEDIKCNNITKW